MTIEEFFAQHKDYIKTCADGWCSEDALKELLLAAWQDGYEFRIKEEELNKGASF